MTNSEYVKALRQLADVYEKHPEMTLPYEGVSSIMWVFTWEAEEFARTVAAFGKGNKRFADDSLLFLPDIGGLNIQVRCQREQVCERKVIGRKFIPEKIVPAKAAEIIPAHEEDIVEWDCKPILAKKPTVPVEVTEPPMIATTQEIDIPF